MIVDLEICNLLSRWRVVAYGVARVVLAAGEKVPGLEEVLQKFGDRAHIHLVRDLYLTASIPLLPCVTPGDWMWSSSVCNGGTAWTCVVTHKRAA